jgi:hypothetical protein
VGPVIVVCFDQSAVDHITMVPSPFAVASLPPSGDTAPPFTDLGLASINSSNFPSGTDVMRTTPLV